MAQSGFRGYRVGMVVALVVAGSLGGIGVPAASAQVTAVRGSAFGYQLLNVSLFNGTPNNVGPVPTVSLPAAGSATALTASAPTGSAAVDPATFFTSGQLDVSTQGTTAGGSVTSSARVANVNTSQAEVLTAAAISSTCTASSAGVTGSTTITGGTLQTDSGDNDPANAIPDHPATTVTVPVNPAPNTSVAGHLHLGNTTDSFTYVFNEQIHNADGSLTVNAAHQHFLGDIARGDLIIGQSVCGVTGSAPASTTTTAGGATSTTTAPGATTTAVNATTTLAPATTTTLSTTTTVPATTTTAAGGSTGGVSGGAYGFFTSVSLFGGAAASRGPAPTITLPPSGSATPLTATAPSGSAQFGPATLFTSDQLDVSTQGTPGGTVTSSATIANTNKSGQEQFTASSVKSTCSATGTAQTGSTSLAGAKLITSLGTNLDSDADDVVVQLPSDPAPNTPYQGKIENVGDTFRVVVNEQIRSAGSITVNAVHIYLLGPTAVGELIIGQSRCATTTAASGGGSTAGGGSSGGGSTVATTGTESARMVALALFLLMAGWIVTFWARGLKGRRPAHRPMPWAKRSLLR